MDRVRCLAATVHYGPNLVLYTASSGRVAGLDELYLVIELDGRLMAFGEVRENIAYLTGIEPSAVRRAVIRLLDGIDWTDAPQAICDRLNADPGPHPAIARALVDCTLNDWIARLAGVPLAVSLGGGFRPALSTNQTLFWSEDAKFLTMAKDYVRRGFLDLKVRVGAGDFEHDLRRLGMVRDAFGDAVKIAIDVNGAWSFDEARHRLTALEPLHIAYAEQPIAAGDWERIAALAEQSPIPIMLDESIHSLADVSQVIVLGGQVWAHLKIVKLGGITPVMTAVRRLREAGVPFMIGQMNEGSGATAAACHCTMAAEPQYAELYGADGLLDDPVSGLAYRNGTVQLAPGDGLGVAIDTSKTSCIWEKRL